MPNDQHSDRSEPDAPVLADAPVVDGGEGDDFDDIVEKPRPLWARVGIAILAIAVTLFIFPLIAKMFVPPINPTQPAPPSHVSLDCQTCHTISADVPVKPVR